MYKKVAAAIPIIAERMTLPVPGSIYAIAGFVIKRIKNNIGIKKIPILFFIFCQKYNITLCV